MNWIKVTDKLPDNTRDVLVLRNLKHLGLLTPDIAFYNKGFTVWYVNYGQRTSDDITYWTEIPEYKDELDKN